MVFFTSLAGEAFGLQSRWELGTPNRALLQLFSLPYQAIVTLSEQL
ncbi:hypothetical protein Q427_08600 [Halomonas sp. BC04]|nr:hypothetical protein Q427_08600 [Halomonas sp. BC04]